MKQIVCKIYKKILICTFAAIVFLAPLFAFAQGVQKTDSDPTITNLLAINSTPAPNGLVDITVFYDNVGIRQATSTVITIDYDEAQFYNISLGDTTNCRDDGDLVTCNYSSNIKPNTPHTVGFTARVMPEAEVGTRILTTASITADVNEDTDNDFGTMTVIVTAPEEGGLMGPQGLPGALSGISEIEVLGEPSENQGVALFDVQNNPNWKLNRMSTAGLKFMIRGKEALAWTLNIEDAGFHNPAITSSYLKVLTVVNSLFIIGLLAIAAMWMFSILIPRNYLRRVVLIYGMAVIFVNFALPLNQLFIDGTNLLQKTFLGGVNIANIVETPNYNDESAIGYQNETSFLKKSATKKINLNLDTQGEEIAEGAEISNDIVIGKIGQDSPNPIAPTVMGTIMFPVADDEGSIHIQEETIQLRSLTDPQIYLNSNQSLELIDETAFNPDQEHGIFAFLMMFFTGLAYFGMSLIFILRIVILWALMIASPILFLLAIFRATRSYFYNWLGIYARWLLIGPLMALGIAIVVNIWQAVGLPIVSSYQGLGEFGMLSNIAFYLPGKEVANNLSTTPQMMEYLLFLIMLYLPIFFAFMLTRQKLWSAAATTIVEKREATRTRKATTEKVGEESAKEVKPAEKMLTGAKAIAGGIKGFLGSKFAGMTKAGMPESMRTAEPRTAATIETAHSLLPEHLALKKMGDVLDLASGEAKGSRNSHKKAIENLASPENITNAGEQKKVMAVRNEISERAAKGDAGAVNILNEIHEHEKTIASAPMGAPVGASMGEIHAAAPEVTPVIIREEAGKKVAEKERPKQVEPSKPKTAEDEEEEPPSAESEKNEEEEEEDKAIKDQEEIDTESSSGKSDKKSKTRKHSKSRKSRRS